MDIGHVQVMKPYVVVLMQHVSECLKLTEEFRQLSDRHANHEDKLQVSMQLNCVLLVHV